MFTSPRVQFSLRFEARGRNVFSGKGSIGKRDSSFVVELIRSLRPSKKGSKTT